MIRRFNARLRSIQFKFRDLKIDSGDAYCDLLVLSGFRKPDTEYQLWIDDIAVTGFLPARIARREQGSQQAPVRNPTRVAIEGSCWTIAGKPFFIRAVEHNGESFAFLRQLGFNSVLLKRHPTLRELEQAQQYQLWILCPPISRGPTTDSLLSSRNIEMVLAWNLGCDLTSNDLDLAQAQVDALESVEDLIDRPVFCHAHFPIDRFARLVDFQRFRSATWGTSFDLQRYRRYLEQSRAVGRPFLVDIQTCLPAKIVEQSVALDSVLPGGMQTSTCLDANQIESLIFESLRCGARGFVFESRSNLEEPARESAWLAPVFRVINRKLVQIDPWISGGSLSSADSGHAVSISFDLPRSQLTCARSTGKHTPRKRSRTLALETSQKSPRVYRVTGRGISPVNHQTRIGKLLIDLDGQSGFERFVVSEDSLSFRYILQSTARFENEGNLLDDELKILQNSYRRLQSLIEVVSENQVSSPATFVALSEIRKMIEVAQTFLNRNQVATTETLLRKIGRKIDATLGVIELELQASRRLISSPFNSDFSQLANYVMLERSLKRSRWSGNRLPGGAFSTLGQLSRSGWLQHLNDSSEVEATVMLVGAENGTGRLIQPGGKSLQIQTWDSADDQRLIEVTPVWLTSPLAPVERGQVIRVDGYVRIDEEIARTRDGFMVMDTIGGPELASRFYKTDGWQYFALERIVPENMDFGLVLAQTGLGQVQVSSLQVRVCRIAAPASNPAAPASNPTGEVSGAVSPQGHHSPNQSPDLK
ncbi:MAG: hypothetical protein VX768_12450 [Planctomycetota bacterium]|nr:hypothetical protein [Planctomycetota bacterium]